MLYSITRTAGPILVENKACCGAITYNQNEIEVLTDLGKSAEVVTLVHDIRPKDKRALRWVGKNGFVFAKVVHHPGTKADPFLYEAAENERININAIFDRYTSEAIRKAGLYG